MKWQGRRKSSNVEDRRGKGGKVALGGGVGLILYLVFTLLSGGNMGDVITNLPMTEPNEAYVETAEERELADFVSVVLADTEDIWTELLEKEGLLYRDPKMVIFTGRVQSGCGTGVSEIGPFYCSQDETIYIDLSFFRQLKDRFGAPGDFAMAYVVAHEVGHHVQKITGILDQVHELRPRISQEEYNQYSVRLELQADYLAGVWGHNMARSGYLEEGDLEEALNAASAIGDDTLQKKAQGYVVPDSFTHGTSEQRQRWFYKGFKTGDLSEWDTFNTDNL